jgi:hypothetical protein
MGRIWFEAGIRFGCTQGGDCCHNHGGYDRVYFTRNEERALATFLAVTMRVLRRKFLREENGYRVARVRSGACIFLEGCRCSIYPVRPTPCRTWPFWPDTMKRTTWQKEVVPFCRGVGRGRLYTREEIERSMREKAAHDRELDDD